MAESVTIHSMDELDKAINEAITSHRKKLDAVADLAKGKTVEVGAALLTDLKKDQCLEIVSKLSLREILLFSGQGRHLTTREKMRIRQ